MQTARRFLLLYAGLHILGGLLLPLLVDTSLFAGYNAAVAQAFSLQDPAAQAQTRYLTGLMGPTVASWGLLFALAVHQAFVHPSRLAWWGLVLAGLLWAPYDSLLAWLHGILLNAAINALSLLALLIPLLCVRRHFLEATRP